MNFFLETDDIGLKIITDEDNLTNYVNWFNDQEVTEFSNHGIFPMTIKDIKHFLDSLDRTSLHLSIYEKSENIHIGNLSLQSIDSINRSAEFAIIMGEKAFWKKGYAFIAAQLIINHAFKRMNLRRIY